MPALSRPKMHTTAATTLGMSTRVRHALTGRLLLPEDVITSPETRLGYRIESELGEGGFGQAYLATRLGRSRLVPQIVCVKFELGSGLNL